MGGWEVALFGGSWWWVVGCLEDWGGWSWVRSHGCHGLAVGISPLSGSGAFSVWPPPAANAAGEWVDRGPCARSALRIGQIGPRPPTGAEAGGGAQGLVAPSRLVLAVGTRLEAGMGGY